MGKIIAVANQKGGVGKTTTTINLAAAVAEKDRKVLLVDMDSQSNATSGVGVDKNAVENSIYELISGDCTFDECVVHTEFKNLDVIPSSPDLTAAEIELLSEEKRDAKLKNVLDAVKDQYEFIFIDCPPSLNLLTVNALTAADSVLVPIQCEYYALEGLSQLLQTISFVKERTNVNLKIEGIVFTMYDARVRLSSQVVNNVKRNLDEKTFRTVIPRNVRLAEAPSHGKPVMYYTRFCSGTRAYRNLAKEVVAVYEAELSEREKKAALLAEQQAAEEAKKKQAEEEQENKEEKTEEAEDKKEQISEEKTDVAEAEEKTEKEEKPEKEEKTEKEEKPETAESGEKAEEKGEEKVEEKTAEEPEEKSDETLTEADETTEESPKESAEDKYADIIKKAEQEINAGIDQ